VNETAAAAAVGSPSPATTAMCDIARGASRGKRGMETGKGERAPLESTRSIAAGVPHVSGHPTTVGLP